MMIGYLIKNHMENRSKATKTKRVFKVQPSRIIKTLPKLFENTLSTSSIELLTFYMRLLACDKKK